VTRDDNACEDARMAHPASSEILVRQLPLVTRCSFRAAHDDRDDVSASRAAAEPDSSMPTVVDIDFGR